MDRLSSFRRERQWLRRRLSRRSGAAVSGPLGQELAAACARAERQAVSEAFALALERMPRWKVLDRPGTRRAGKDFLQAEGSSLFVDYLADYFATGDATYKKLFLGEKIKSLYDADEAERERHTVEVDAAELGSVEGILRGRGARPPRSRCSPPS